MSEAFLQCMHLTFYLSKIKIVIPVIVCGLATNLSLTTNDQYILSSIYWPVYTDQYIQYWSVNHGLSGTGLRQDYQCKWRNGRKMRKTHNWCRPV